MTRGDFEQCSNSKVHRKLQNKTERTDLLKKQTTEVQL